MWKFPLQNWSRDRWMTNLKLVAPIRSQMIYTNAFLRYHNYICKIITKYFVGLLDQRKMNVYYKICINWLLVKSWQLKIWCDLPWNAAFCKTSSSISHRCNLIIIVITRDIGNCVRMWHYMYKATGLYISRCIWSGRNKHSWNPYNCSVRQAGRQTYVYYVKIRHFVCWRRPGALGTDCRLFWSWFKDQRITCSFSMQLVSTSMQILTLDIMCP